MLEQKSPHHIKKIFIEKLFGRYTYTLPAQNETLSELNIIYGENGVGKTTLLNLVFHMLSPADNRGHRKKISDTPFAELRIELNDGTIINAKKNSQLLVGPVTFSIQVPGELSVDWHYSAGDSRAIKIEDIPKDVNLEQIPKEFRREVELAIQQRAFFSTISKLRITTYMLTSDRILQGDTLEASDATNREHRNRNHLSDEVAEQRVAAVAQAMATASGWLRSKFFDKSYGGGSESSPYEDVVRKIAKNTYRTRSGLSKGQEEKVIGNLKTMIFDLERKAKDLSRFGLGVTTLSPEISGIIESTHGNKLLLINSILEPYLSGIKARQDKVYPLYELISNLIESINKFFVDKELHYSIRSKTGFRILISPLTETPQEISPSQLSSGEQQLVLLFCCVLVARDAPSVFIIDEPEISLNIVWQRMLVAALQELSKGSELQFLFASHSMEILSKHRKRVISIEESRA